MTKLRVPEFYLGYYNFVSWEPMQNVTTLGQPLLGEPKRKEREKDRKREEKKTPLIVDTKFRLPRPRAAHALRSDQKHTYTGQKYELGIMLRIHNMV